MTLPPDLAPAIRRSFRYRLRWVLPGLRRLWRDWQDRRRGWVRDPATGRYLPRRRPYPPQLLLVISGAIPAPAVPPRPGLARRLARALFDRD